MLAEQAETVGIIDEYAELIFLLEGGDLVENTHCSGHSEHAFGDEQHSAALFVSLGASPCKHLLAVFDVVVAEFVLLSHMQTDTVQQAGEALGWGAMLSPHDLAAVAVTQGPGLVGALVVGMAFAKGLAWAADKPLVCVNHLEGHLFANLFETPDLEPPFVASLLSGGHTMLVHVRDWGDYRILGETLDDAVGEAFDKVAKALGLGYPGGPIISRLAKTGNPKAIDFPRAMLHSHDYRFSLSGLKTAVVTYINA